MPSKRICLRNTNLPVPLRSDDEAVVVSLQPVFDTLYRKGRYANRLDYQQLPPSPKRSVDEQNWLKTVVVQ